MYFDFEDGHPDLERVPSAFTPREGAMASVIVHLSALLLLVLLPKLPYFQRLAAEKAAAQAKLAELHKQPPTRFVFVQPRVEFTPKRPPPPNAPLADLDRNAMTVQRPPNPKNPQPFKRAAGRSERFWLCDQCSNLMTLAVDSAQKVILMPLPRTTPLVKRAIAS